MPPRAPVLAALLALAFLLPARANTDKTFDVYKMLELGLYQPNNVLVDRLGTKADALANYIKALNDAAGNYVAMEKAPGHPAVIDLVVVVKPTGVSKVWIVDPSSSGAAPIGLAQKLQAVPVPNVVHGPVAFSIHVSLWGGTDPNLANYRSPLPDEWKAALKAAGKPLLIPDDVLPAVWKD
jgi:hypothetical protein